MNTSLGRLVRVIAPRPSSGDRRQQGRYATRYSNVFDLKSGAIFVSTDQSRFARLDLATELKKGRHFYDLQAVAKASGAEPSLHE